MDINFDFFTAPEIYFGNGRINELPEHCAKFGKKVLIVKGSSSLEKSGLLQNILDKFTMQEFTVAIKTVASEPETDLIDHMVEETRTFGADVIVAIGGGSVLDAGKAVAGLVTNGGSIMEYLEGVGAGRHIEKPAVPFIAVPTTSGTGTEVTKNAVISSRKLKFKKSIRHPYLIPKIAIVDPVLTRSQPPQITASCGMDALTQLIEPYVSLKSNPLIDAICQKGIGLVVNSLLRAYKNGEDAQARENMSLASLMGGIALANAGLGAVHGLASPLGAFFPLAHGTACATTLPSVFETNFNALLERGNKTDVAGKFADVARLLTGSAEKDNILAMQLGAAWLKDLKKQLNIPSLSKLGIRQTDIPFIVKESRGSSMKTNPVVLTDDEIRKILVDSL